MNFLQNSSHILITKFRAIVYHKSINKSRIGMNFRIMTGHFL